jgi:hypothetical protein
MTQNMVVRAWRWTIVLIATGLMTVLAFGRLFTTFAPYDDEGYFLIAYRDFLSGRTLYDQVFAPYGPFAFFSAGLLARFDAANITHDAFRWIILPVWVAIAALLGGVVWRWTGRFAVSLSVFLLVGLNLQPLARGVGHPQLWIIAASAMLLWLGCDWASQPGKEWRAFWTGMIVAAILLFKLNIGIFSLVAIVLMLSMHLAGWSRVVFSGLSILGASALGIMLFFSTPSYSDKYFALAYVTSLGTTIVAVIRLSADRHIQPACIPWLAGGFGACGIVGLGVTLGSGTTLRGLFDNTIFAALKFANLFHNPFWGQKGSLLMSLIGFSAAAIALSQPRIISEYPVGLGLLKIAAGVTLLCEFWLNNRLALTGSLLFLWLLVVDIPRRSDYGYFNRLLLALLSALLSLQLYPMAGDQVDWAGLLPMVAMAVLLADGAALLGMEAEIAWLPRLSYLAGRAAGILLACVLFASLGANALQSVREWRWEQPLNLPGARWLHLPKGTVNSLTATVSQIARKCDSILMIPGLYSFALWSGVRPFEDKRFNTAAFLWPEDILKHEIPAIRLDSHGCILVSQSVYDFLKTFAVSNGHSELLKEVQQTMNPIAIVNAPEVNWPPLTRGYDITIYRPQ